MATGVVLGATVRYETSVKIFRDEITIRLLEYQDGICAVEHRKSQCQSGSLSQIFVLNGDYGLAEFISADPDLRHLRMQYAALASEFLETQVSKDCLNSEASQPAWSFTSCKDEAKLVELARYFIKRTGGVDFLFRRIRLNAEESDILEHQCIVGCHPGWMHKYCHHAWYMNDPFIEHAKRRTTPVTGDDVGLGGGPHWMHTSASEYGFRYTAVFPAHSRSGWIGLLQVSAPDASTACSMIVGEKRVTLRQLVIELLDWWLTRDREIATYLFGLDERDMAVLRILKAGGNATNVRAILGLSRRRSEHLYKVINRKFGTTHISKALDAATAHGLQLLLALNFQSCSSTPMWNGPTCPIGGWIPALRELIESSYDGDRRFSQILLNTVTSHIRRGGATG